MSAVAKLAGNAASSSDRISLVCASGHRTQHSLARVLRLNDGWCGACGADISYTPEGIGQDEPRGQPSGTKRLAAVTTRPA